MKKNILIVFTLMIVTAVPGFSDENASIGGYVTSSVWIPSGWNDDWDYKKLSAEMQLAADYSSGIAKLYGALYFEIDDLAGPGAFADKLSIRPGEMYLSLYLNSLDVTAGYQIVSWGTADGLNPTNNINPKDLSELINMASTDMKDTAIPVNALRLDFYPTDFLMIEGVFIPLFTPPGMPDFSSYLPPELSAVTFNFSYPDEEALASFEAGFRAGFMLPGIDFSLSYLYAWDDLPDVKVNIVQQDLGGGIMFGFPASLDFSFNRVHIIGADFAWPVLDIDFRGEAAFFITDDLAGDDAFVKNPYLQYVLGAGYTFFDNLTVTLQFSQKITTNFKKAGVLTVNQSDQYYIEGYSEQFSHLVGNQKGAVMSTVMLIVRKNFMNDLLETTFAGIYNFPEDYTEAETDEKYGDFMLRPSFTYKAADAFDIGAGANLFFSMKKDAGGDIVSDPYTTFGMLDEEDSFYIELKYSY
ncbi:MAG: hypothetical protein JW881_17785 [Spirochaetales bacterium]|nr:hypothetical protein [Spirochaetales bacterium]